MERVQLNFNEDFWRLRAIPELLSFALELVSLFTDSKGLDIKQVKDKDSLNRLVEMGIFSIDKGRVKLSSTKFIALGKKKTDEKKETLNNRRLADVSESEIEDENLRFYFKIARSFQVVIWENLKRLNVPLNNVREAKFEKWVNPIRLMITTDGVTTEDLRKLYSFLQNHDFWSDKIQSTEKLRAKKETLIGQMRNDEKRKKTDTKGGAKLSPEYLNDLQRRLQGGS